MPIPLLFSKQYIELHKHTLSLGILLQISTLFPNPLLFFFSREKKPLRSIESLMVINYFGKTLSLCRTYCVRCLFLTAHKCPINIHARKTIYQNLKQKNLPNGFFLFSSLLVCSDVIPVFAKYTVLYHIYAAD